MSEIPTYEPRSFLDVARGNALADQKTYEALDLERNVVTQASAAFVRRRAAIAQARIAAKRMRQMEQAVHGRNMELRLGTITIVDLLNIVAELTEANVAKINIEFERDRTTYALTSA